MIQQNCQHHSSRMIYKNTSILDYRFQNQTTDGQKKGSCSCVFFYQFAIDLLFLPMSAEPNYLFFVTSQFLKQQSVQNYLEYLVLPESSQRALVIGEIWGSLTNHCPFYRRYKLSLDQKISLDRKVSSKQQLSFELKLTLDLKSAIFRFKDLFRCKRLSGPV